jgi:hypothetical protein
LGIDNQDNLYVADLGHHCIKKISPTGKVTTFAGDPNKSDIPIDGIYAILNYPGNLAFDKNNSIVYVLDNSGLRRIIELKWSPARHYLFNETIRNAIKTVMKLALLDILGKPKYPSALFYKAPKDILFVILKFVAEST